MIHRDDAADVNARPAMGRLESEASARAASTMV